MAPFIYLNEKEISLYDITLLNRNYHAIFVTGQIGHALNNTASQLAAHSSTLEAEGLLVAAGFGFIPGLLFGLERITGFYLSKIFSRINKR
jgi:hypothetical protein